MIHHTIHHNFTTKTPLQTPGFSKTPTKNAHKSQTRTFQATSKFLLKKTGLGWLNGLEE
jgi:hypothetical protein